MNDTMATFGLDAANPVHVAAWDIASRLNEDGTIAKFDASIIFLIIQILQSLAPLLEEYCGDDVAEIVERARTLRGWRRLNWLLVLRSHIVNQVGQRGWRRLGKRQFTKHLVAAVAENKGDVVGKVMRVCG